MRDFYCCSFYVFKAQFTPEESTGKELVRDCGDCMEMGKSDLRSLEQFLGRRSILTRVFLASWALFLETNNGYKKIQHWK